MKADDTTEALATLHANIDGCRQCETIVDELHKPTQLVRGDAGSILVVGQSPGRTEKQRKRAFAGQSGTRLDRWLVGCGAPEDDPRRGVYLTSVLKCTCPKQGLFKRMAKNCSPFLHEQIRLIKPRLVISLGADAYSVLRLDQQIKYADALCTTQRSRDHLLITHYGYFYNLLIWPHPSGLNHWHNKPENTAQLEASFAAASTYFKA